MAQLVPPSPPPLCLLPQAGGCRPESARRRRRGHRGPSRPTLPLSWRYAVRRRPPTPFPLATVHPLPSASRISRKTELQRSTPRRTTVATGLHSPRHDVQEIRDGAPRRPALLIRAKNHRRRRQLPRDGAAAEELRRQILPLPSPSGIAVATNRIRVSRRYFSLSPSFFPSPLDRLRLHQ